MIENIRKNIIFSLLITSLIFITFAVISDFDLIFKSFSQFNWQLFPLLILLSLCNYYFRFLKWEYYLKVLDINIPKIYSLKIFLSGFVMTISPVKMGEVIKSVLLKELNNDPISKTAPIVIAERLTDFFALSIIASIGILIFNFSYLLIAVVLSILILIVVIISNEQLFEKLFSLVNKISFIKKYSEKLSNLYKSSHLLIKTRHLIPMIMNSIVSWSFECFGFYLILINFDLNISIQFAFYIYAFSIVAGAVSMLPGGLGVTEGSLSLMLINSGISKETAVASTLITRVATLWFAVLLGSVVLFFFQRQIKNSLINK